MLEYCKAEPYFPVKPTRNVYGETLALLLLQYNYCMTKFVLQEFKAIKNK